MNRLANKHCVIVGGRGVIGSAIAREFSRQGAILTILGRTDPDAVSQRMSHKLEPYTPRNGYDTAKNDDLPTKHRFLALDATNSEDCKRIFQRGVAEPVKAHNKGQNIGVGKVDVLVNCAGITQNHMLKRLGDDEMGEILETNLVATMLACKYARMQDAGCIINVSSLLALRGGRGASVYAASKAAIIAFTRAQCDEQRVRGIRINALLPGWVNSPMWHDLPPRMKQGFVEQTPLGRPAEPEEIADAAMFLATNTFANNCVLNIDGGLSAI